MPVQKKGGGERRLRLGVMRQGARGGAPSLLFKGGRRAWGGGVLVGLPPPWAGGLGAGEESSSPTNLCLAPLGLLDPFLGVYLKTKKGIKETKWGKTRIRGGGGFLPTSHRRPKEGSPTRTPPP